MQGIKINLGCGIIIRPSSFRGKIVNNDYFIWDEIIRFNVNKDSLQKLHPGFEELFETFYELKNLGFFN